MIRFHVELTVDQVIDWISKKLFINCQKKERKTNNDLYNDINTIRVCLVNPSRIINALFM